MRATCNQGAAGHRHGTNRSDRRQDRQHQPVRRSRAAGMLDWLPPVPEPGHQRNSQSMTPSRARGCSAGRSPRRSSGSRPDHGRAWSGRPSVWPPRQTSPATSIGSPPYPRLTSVSYSPLRPARRAHPSAADRRHDCRASQPGTVLAVILPRILPPRDNETMCEKHPGRQAQEAAEIHDQP